MKRAKTEDAALWKPKERSVKIKLYDAPLYKFA